MLVTLMEPKSRQYQTKLVVRKQAEVVRDAMIEMQRQYISQVHAITHYLRQRR